MNSGSGGSAYAEGREPDQQARDEDHKEACRTPHTDYLLRILGVVKILRGLSFAKTFPTLLTRADALATGEGTPGACR